MSTNITAITLTNGQLTPSRCRPGLFVIDPHHTLYRIHGTARLHTDGGDPDNDLIFFEDMQRGSLRYLTPQEFCATMRRALHNPAPTIQLSKKEHYND